MKKSIFNLSIGDNEEFINDINKVIGCITGDFDNKVFNDNSGVYEEDNIIKVYDESVIVKIEIGKDYLSVEFMSDEIICAGSEIASAKSDKYVVTIKELEEDNLVNVSGRKFSQEVVCANRCVIKQSSNEVFVANSFNREEIRLIKNNVINKTM